jgi:hypothetical protein
MCAGAGGYSFEDPVTGEKAIYAGSPIVLLDAAVEFGVPLHNVLFCEKETRTYELLKRTCRTYLQLHSSRISETDIDFFVKDNIRKGDFHESCEYASSEPVSKKQRKRGRSAAWVIEDKLAELQGRALIFVDQIGFSHFGWCAKLSNFRSDFELLASGADIVLHVTLQRVEPERLAVRLQKSQPYHDHYEYSPTKEASLGIAEECAEYMVKQRACGVHSASALRVFVDHALQWIEGSELPMFLEYKGSLQKRSPDQIAEKVTEEIHGLIAVICFLSRDPVVTRAAARKAVLETVDERSFALGLPFTDGLTVRQYAPATSAEKGKAVEESVWADSPFSRLFPHAASGHLKSGSQSGSK